MSQELAKNHEKILSQSRENIDYNMTFFTPSTTKLIVMYLCTFGIYMLYWFYKNWVVIKKAGKDCIPFWRTFFSPLFVYSCFWYIRESMIRNKVEHEEFPIVFLSISYVILSILGNSSFPICLVGFLMVVPVIAANQVALAINKKLIPNFVSNNKFSAGNWMIIVLTGLLVIGVVIQNFLISSVR